MPKLKEEWKQITGMHYLISNKGRCKNTKTKRFVRPVRNSGGYYQYILTEKGKYSHFLVHRIVAEYFLKPDLAKPYVSFKEKNKVKWCTYNIQRTKHKYSRSVSAYTEQGKKVKDFDSITEAVKYVQGNDIGGIVRCARGKQKLYSGYVWKYSE